MNLKTLAAASVIAFLPMASYAALDISVTSNDGVGADDVDGHDYACPREKDSLDGQVAKAPGHIDCQEDETNSLAIGAVEECNKGLILIFDVFNTLVLLS